MQTAMQRQRDDRNDCKNNEQRRAKTHDVALTTGINGARHSLRGVFNIGPRRRIDVAYINRRKEQAYR